MTTKDYIHYPLPFATWYHMAQFIGLVRATNVEQRKWSLCESVTSSSTSIWNKSGCQTRRYELLKTTSLQMFTLQRSQSVKWWLETCDSAIISYRQWL